jgi:hypothetical protein
MKSSKVRGRRALSRASSFFTNSGKVGIMGVARWVAQGGEDSAGPCWGFFRVVGVGVGLSVVRSPLDGAAGCFCWNGFMDLAFG